MPKVVQSAKGRVIVFDQKDEQRQREQHNKIYELSRLIRDAGFNLYRCVNATIDPVSISVFNLSSKDSDKAVVEIYFPSETPETVITDAMCEMQIKEVSRFIAGKAPYKVLKTHLHKDEVEPDKIIGKILVGIPQPPAQK